MLERTRQAAIEHAKREVPRESCGLIVLDGRDELYVPCKNIAENAQQFFLDPRDYLAADEKYEAILAVVHSHPGASSRPSEADRVACERSGLPWHIVGLPDLDWSYLEPSGFKAPLVGRNWHHGILDCYSLIRDWYLETRGIELLDFDRREEWWDKGDNLYFDNYERAGFHQVDRADMQTGDVILMQVRSKVPNHAAIYLGKGWILHHLRDRLSTRELFDGYWQRHTRRVIRYFGNP